MRDVLGPGIDLRIEELTLHGFAHADRNRIGEMVERELARLLAEQGVPPSLMRGGDWPTISLGSFQVQQGAKPETIGAQVARAVYRGLSMGAQVAARSSTAAAVPTAGADHDSQTQGKGESGT